MALTLAIVGRPNVGKSTLFNRLVGRRTALVDDRPGLTRDRREGAAQLGDLTFRLIDTPGLDDAPADSIEARMREQTERAVGEADAVLFVIDARVGVTPIDRHFANWLRRLGARTVLVANKCESAKSDSGLIEAHELGMGEAVAISAEHGQGLSDLHRALKESIAFADEPATIAEPGKQPIRVAIVGRPNVGKSTLVNRLLGEERMLTGPEPGITRDAIAAPWRWRDRDFVLVDTAGLRRKARIDDPVEIMSTADALRAVRAAHVVVLTLDARAPLERQDLSIAGLAIDEGRALVVAVNKWDLVETRQATLKALRDRIEFSLPQVEGVRFATVSALHGHKIEILMGEIVGAHDLWNAEIAAPKLNRFLETATESHPPPMVQGRRPRLRFVKQVATRPPTFAVFGSRLTGLPDAYQRYLVNGLRKTFALPGVVIRLRLRQTENPYADKRKRQ